MHIPDGFLSAKVNVFTWIISLVAVSVCLKKTARLLEDKMIPLMGVMSAFVFAIQMIDFPVVAGTSGHLSGGVLASVLLGPYAAVIVLSCVLSVQCLIFQDGGLVALGANILNVAVFGAGGGYCIYRLISKITNNRRSIVTGAIFASWFSVVIAAVLCALELALSGVLPLKIVLPAMAGFYMLVGIPEGIISGLVIEFVLKVRPDLILRRPTNRAL
jgi:cobalt/nickel transport system permease protein